MTMTKDALIEFLRTRAEITLTAEQDDIPVRGNALASGDDEVDRACEDAILDRLESGDVWAWASVRVRATYRRYSGSDYLGACSYADEEAFRAPGEYYDAMRDRALENLAFDMLSHVVELEEVHAEQATIEQDARDAPEAPDAPDVLDCSHSVIVQGESGERCEFCDEPTPVPDASPCAHKYTSDNSGIGTCIKCKEQEPL